jgi:hypothetical protein
VLDLLRMGLDSAVLGLGHSSISQLSRNDFLIPEGFEAVLGADGPAHVATQSPPKKDTAKRPIDKTVQ